MTARDTVLAAIAKVTGIHAGDDVPLPGDSLERVDVVLAIQEALDVDLDDEAFRLPTVGALIEHVETKARGA